MYFVVVALEDCLEVERENLAMRPKKNRKRKRKTDQRHDSGDHLRHLLCYSLKIPGAYLSMGGEV